MRLSFKTIVVLAFTLIQMPGFGNQKASHSSVGSRPNIILIVSDDHGMGDLGCYSNSAISTPNLDKLAGDGVRFTQAYCSSASCSPSRSVILSGVHNHANGMLGLSHRYHNFSSFKHIQSLPVLLNKLAGYKTARIGKFHVSPEEVYHFEEELHADILNPVDLANACRPYLEKVSDDPFFLYYCTIDPHRGGEAVEDHPYKPNKFHNKEEGYEGVEPYEIDEQNVVVPYYLPDNPATRAELVQYYEAVDRLDQGVGTLIEHLKETGHYKNSLIIYITDNGIAFPGAKTNIYQAAINLPCIIKLPSGKRANSVNDAMISWTDITPTLLDFAGVLPQSKKKIKEAYDQNKERWDNTHVPGFHGNSIKELLETGNSGGRDTIFASHTFHEITMYYPMRTIVTRKYKLIWNVASALPYPGALDLWNSATWQYALKHEGVRFGGKSTEYLSNRPEFELFDLEKDSEESINLADDEAYAGVLNRMKEKLKEYQENTQDPWVIKWKRE